MKGKDMTRRIFVDMDGTLAKWNNVSTKDLYEKGYYRNLEPNQNLINEIKRLIDDREDVYILSSFLSDSEYALVEKNLWLDEHLPEISCDKRIFVHYGDNKKDYIINGVTALDYLIDDYTKNLLDWKEAGGTGIKFLNGINHTRKTWKGFLLKADNMFSDNLKSIFDKSSSFNNYLSNEFIDHDIVDEYC